MQLPTALDTHHTVTSLTLHALILLLQSSPQLVPTYHHLSITLAATTIRAYTSPALAYLHEVMILEVGMGTISYTKFAIVHILVHLFKLATSKADVIVKRVCRSVELVANVTQLIIRVKVIHRKSLRHCHCLREMLEF